MPPAASISLELLETLARERLGAGASVVEADLDRLEMLAADLVLDKDFPEDWVIFRITGEQRVVHRPSLISGARLLQDLSALSERLSQQARLPATSVVTDVATLAARWNVNKKTIDRYRRQGLVARRLIGADRKSRLCFTPTAIMRFEELRQAELASAGSFVRIDEVSRSKMVRWAACYRRRLGWTLNRAAGRIAERTGRSREAVRRVLQLQQRFEKRTRTTMTFAEPAPLTAVQQKVIFRAMIRGGEPGDLARRYKKPLGSIQRAWGIARAQQLRNLQLPVVSREGSLAFRAESLKAVPANFGLRVPVETDLAAFLAAARQPSVPIGVEETARLSAYRELVIRSASLISGLDRNFPRTSEIDEAMTNLRWAARLKALLIHAQFRLMVQNLEAGLQTELSMLRSGPLRKLLTEAINVVADAVDTHAFIQTSSRGRLAAPIALAVNRLAARWQKEYSSEFQGSHASRATAKLLPGVGFPDWTLSVAAWQPVIEPDPRLKPVLSRAASHDQELLTVRFGWGDEPPRTLPQCGQKFNVSAIKIARLERVAMRHVYALLISGERR